MQDGHNARAQEHFNATKQQQQHQHQLPFCVCTCMNVLVYMHLHTYMHICTRHPCFAPLDTPKSSGMPQIPQGNPKCLKTSWASMVSQDDCLCDTCPQDSPDGPQLCVSVDLCIRRVFHSPENRPWCLGGHELCCRAFRHLQSILCSRLSPRNTESRFQDYRFS